MAPLIITCGCCGLRLFGSPAALADADPLEVTEYDRLYWSADWPRPDCPRCGEGWIGDDDERDDGADAWTTHHKIARSMY